MSNLSYQDFISCIDDFVSASKKLHDGWNLLHHGDSTYLSKKFIVPKQFRSTGSFFSTTDEHALINTGNVITDDEYSVQGNKISYELVFDCHIIYSNSYKNPVMYFLISTADGNPFTLQQCWEELEFTFDPKQPDLKWSFVTQVLHPLLQIPFFQLHPCHTEKFMEPFRRKHVENSDKDMSRSNCNNFILSWLSIVLPVLKLDLNIEQYYHILSKS